VSRDIRLVSKDGERTPPAPALDLAHEEKPFLEMGYTIGRLLEDAHRAADELTHSAKQQAAVTLQEANRNAAKIKEEADRAARQIRSEASIVLDDARSAAARLGDQIAHERRLAEAEATVIKREAHREAKMLKSKAQREADAIVEQASGKAAERVRELEHRLRTLQHAEIELKRRVAAAREAQEAQRSIEPEEQIFSDEN
jgi:cell division septum initiation protein DivIVA